MFCSKCGTSNPDTGRFCLGCGSSLEVQPSYPGQAAVPGLASPPSAEPETSGKAIASLICGICFFIFPAAVAAIILGHLSMSEINRSFGRLKGRGMATAGLVLGYGGVLLIPFVLIVAAIAIPNLIRARTVANEASALASLRTIASAAIVYNTKYSSGFPASLSALGGTGDGNASCEHAQLIDDTLAAGRKAGYIFEYVPTGEQVIRSDAKSGGCPIAGSQAFHVNAYPITRGSTGMRTFYIDETAVIRVSSNGFAGANSPALGESNTF